VQLPDRPKTNAALALDAVQGSHVATKLRSTFVLSTLFSAGELITAGDFATSTLAASAAAFAMPSETTDVSVSCRERFRAGDSKVGDAAPSTLGSAPSTSERSRLDDFSVADGKS